MREVIYKLGVFDKFTYSVEPYWKFSDMYLSVVETQCRLKREYLQSIANIWEDYSDDILTSDTINGNVIKIKDVAMIDIWY